MPIIIITLSILTITTVDAYLCFQIMHILYPEIISLKEVVNYSITIGLFLTTILQAIFLSFFGIFSFFKNLSFLQEQFELQTTVQTVVAIVTTFGS